MLCRNRRDAERFLPWFREYSGKDAKRWDTIRGGFQRPTYYYWLAIVRLSTISLNDGSTSSRTMPPEHTAPRASWKIEWFREYHLSALSLPASSSFFFFFFFCSPNFCPNFRVKITGCTDLRIDHRLTLEILSYKFVARIILHFFH